MTTKIYTNIFYGLLFSFAFVLGSYLYPAETTTPIHYQSIRVQTGDTLWSLAAKCTDESRDIREVVYEIKQLNQINDAGDLMPGATLKIPVTEKIDLSHDFYIAQK